MDRIKTALRTLAVLFFLSALFLTSCSKDQPAQTVLSEVSVIEPTTVDKPVDTPIPLALVTDGPQEAAQADSEQAIGDGGDDPQVRVLRIRAVGDLMMHDRQLRSAKTADGNYDFSQYFANIASEIQDADLSIGNLETPVGTEDFSGFPLFNAPPQFLDVIAQAGFDAVSLANNHMLDRGAKGIEATTQQLRDRGLLYTGAGSEQENASPLLMEKNGIKVALLSYTRVLNINPPRSGPSLKVLSRDAVARDVKLAKEAGADFLIAFVHWGNEYEQAQSPDQVLWAQTLADAGVDAILGAHPHVLQPIVTIAAADGRQVFCAYSLGNFVSNQPDFPRYIGGIAELTLQKDMATGKTVLAQSGFIPTWICRTIRPDTTCDYTVLRADRLVGALDDAVVKMADLKAKGALAHAMGVLGKYGAQVIQ